jgi:hypothetical protein
VPACHDAELPQLLRRALEVVDELVQLERVELAGVVTGEPFPDALEQRRELLLVVATHQLTGRLPPGLLAAFSAGHKRRDASVAVSMPLPLDARDSALRQVEQFCRERVPEESLAQLRLEHALRGNSITLIERRPPWSELVGPERSSMKIAQLRYAPKARVWSLYTCDSNYRWWPYDFIEPASDVGPLLAEIDADPTSIFWG